MGKRTITLDNIDPIEILGVNNKLLSHLTNQFDSIKVASRGDSLFIDGDENEIELFNKAIISLVNKRHHKTKLTEDDIDSLFEEDQELKSNVENKQNNNYVIVHGNDGKTICAKTPNQKKLVDEYYKNDLLFAIGPAGTGKTYTAIALAVRALKNREVKRLILTRPAVEAGERLGFLQIGRAHV